METLTEEKTTRTTIGLSIEGREATEAIAMAYSLSDRTRDSCDTRSPVVVEWARRVH